MSRMTKVRRRPIKTAEGQTLGQHIRELRKGRGLTQRELGERIGASIRAVCSYERDECEPPIQILIDLAGALQLSLDELVGSKPVPAAVREPQRRWVRTIEQIQELPERKQRAVLQVLDMALKS